MMIDKSEKFGWLVRLGFAARGLVYILIGYLFLSAPGQNRADDGPSGAFDYLQDLPLGAFILYLCAIGLLAYAFYRLASTFFDVENYGTDTKGIAHRLGHLGSGVAHLFLAYTAFQFASGTKSTSNGSGGAQEATSTVLSFGVGPVLIGLVGLALIVAGIMQGKKAITATFMKRVSPGAPRFTRYLGQAGYAARGVVFVLIGWSLLQSAWFDSSTQLKSLGEAVASLRDNGVLFDIVAAGLLLFGIFSLVMARYRIVPDLDPTGKKPMLPA
ncbi:DUF1206 domain-containing protein [Croceicoccus sp. F390]|uniref:DUF1206 domain-containing protein n=1 Tax=Croceicoccus esteveae TaxID=3075597 RepID=A0ABU2ZM11_9SPHN|nr:DUF1206 domain-containing protein [Croceicoccus sp. F390]MDT0576614.1 DUF1206 domain-containing protein [Croceicoccus sp. F390]